VRSWPDWIAAHGGAGAEQWSRLTSGLREDLLQRAPSWSTVLPHIDGLRRRHRDNLAAVLFYGSCLFGQTQTETSFPDFYLLVADLGRFHRSVVHDLLNRVLPPNVYYGVPVDGSLLPCKVCVISVDQYLKETCASAADIHHLGRFSKRIALAYSRDEQTTRTVVQGMLTAMLTLIPHALTQLPERFSLEEFILRQLGLSYVGEQRILEPDKILRLLRGAEEFYFRVYPDVLALHAHRFGNPVLEGDGRYRQRPADPLARLRTSLFLRRSRVRGILRWPKYMLTVDNWVQYLLDKLERHQGVHVELTERQRRHPLIFGWPIYFEMRRRGLVK
jgi:hypothetical protein